MTTLILDLTLTENTLQTLKRMQGNRVFKHTPFISFQFYINIKFISYRKSLGEEIEEMDTDEEKLEKIALLLGVEKVSQTDIEQFMKNIKHVKPRKSEGYGFGKLSGYVHD